MSFKIISLPVGSTELFERVEIDNIESKIDALYYLECKKDMEAVKPGTTIENDFPAMAFSVLSEDGKSGTTFKVKEK